MPKGGTMKILACCGVFVLLTLLAFPMTAEAFSRRVHSSEVAHTPVQSTPHDNKTESTNGTPQAVPEPPVLLLVGIGIGLFAIYSMTKRLREKDARGNKA
jgi:hypothetical protein